jgi:quercetin dioxygenase-like cupin family protein
MEQIRLTEELNKIRARGAEVGSTTLLKTDTLRIVLMALKPGARLHEHHADGRLLLQVLEGEIEFHAENTQIALQPGMLASVAARVPHSVNAVSDAVLLLTIAWPQQEPAKAGTHRNVGYNESPES